MQADGIAGMAPTSSETSLLQALKDNDSISSRVFSFQIKEAGEPSLLTIGGYDQSASLSWNPLVDTDYWSVKLSKVSIGGSEIPLSASKAIVDSGTSLLLVPAKDFANLSRIWSRNLKCATAGDYFSCEC